MKKIPNIFCRHSSVGKVCKISAKKIQLCGSWSSSKFRFCGQHTCFLENNKASSKFLHVILHYLINTINLKKFKKNQSIKPNFILTTRINLISNQTHRNRGTGKDPTPQIFAKVDLSPIDNYSQKKKVAKIYEPLQIPQKLLVILLSSLLHVIHKLILIEIVSSMLHFFICYHGDYHFGKQYFIKSCLFYWGYKI